MRQIFTSQRLETVEGVARLLEDAGIPVHISKPRSYRSHRGGQFSYAEPESPKTQSAVWVRLPEDQPRARDVLRLRIALLAVIAGVAVFIWLRRPDPAPVAPPAATPAPQTETGEEEEVRYRISPPPAG